VHTEIEFIILNIGAVRWVFYVCSARRSVLGKITNKMNSNRNGNRNHTAKMWFQIKIKNHQSPSNLKSKSLSLKKKIEMKITPAMTVEVKQASNYRRAKILRDNHQYIWRQVNVRYSDKSKRSARDRITKCFIFTTDAFVLRFNCCRITDVVKTWVGSTKPGLRLQTPRPRSRPRLHFRTKTKTEIEITRPNSICP